MTLSLTRVGAGVLRFCYRVYNTFSSHIYTKVGITSKSQSRARQESEQEMHESWCVWRSTHAVSSRYAGNLPTLQSLCTNGKQASTMCLHL